MLRFSMLMLAVVVLTIGVLVPLAHAGTTTGVTNPLAQPSPLAQGKAKLTKQNAIATFLDDAKVRHWLERYPAKPTTDATFKQGVWTVNVFSGKAGEIATGKVDDAQDIVTEAWTGPQVAWKMARGYTGAFGGEKINSYPVWLGFCALFLLGLVDWRRLASVRNLDLGVLLSFSVSLWYFNRGDIFTSAPLLYPPLVYLLVRCVWIARTDRAPRGRTVWPVWLLAAATVFAMGFRVGLNVRASNVIDVGYAGVIGAERITEGRSPYGHFPVEDPRKKCGAADADGEVRERIQDNGRCESANPQGDTYGPVSYEAYLPGFAAFGWSGKWDTLPAVHATSILWDAICLVGLLLVGRRFGGDRLAWTLAFAWAAWPFTQYVSNSNTNDAIVPAFLIWGFFFVTTHWARGAFLALSSWTKFASLLLVPLWSGYPDARRRRSTAHFAIGFAGATVLAFFVLLLEPNALHAARVFFDRTVRWQISRESPFSIWDWRQYHAQGIPDLHWVQRALEAVLVVAALALGWWPRRRSALQLAALTAVLLLGFELVLTHLFYLYLPWFFPFVAFALLAPRRADEPVTVTVIDGERSPSAPLAV